MNKGEGLREVGSDKRLSITIIIILCKVSKVLLLMTPRLKASVSKILLKSN